MISTLQEQVDTLTKCGAEIAAANPHDVRRVENYLRAASANAECTLDVMADIANREGMI